MLYRSFGPAVFALILMAPFTAAGQEKDAVYISPESPWLSEISMILQEQGYRMFTDSTSGAWQAAVEAELEGDSIRYVLSLYDDKGSDIRVIGSFLKTKPDPTETRKQFLNHILLQVLGIVTVSILYFLRF